MDIFCWERPGGEEQQSMGFFTLEVDIILGLFPFECFYHKKEASLYLQY